MIVNVKQIATCQNSKNWTHLLHANHIAVKLGFICQRLSNWLGIKKNVKSHNKMVVKLQNSGDTGQLSHTQRAGNLENSSVVSPSPREGNSPAPECLMIQGEGRGLLRSWEMLAKLQPF